MTTKPTPSLKEEIDNIIGEDGYNLGAYQFEDNKMRFAYTVDQLVQMRKKTLSAFTQAIERAEPEDKISKDKKLCDCPCGGPFCDQLMHPCFKPEEHYPQRDQALVEIRKEIISDYKQRLLAEVK